MSKQNSTAGESKARNRFSTGGGQKDFRRRKLALLGLLFLTCLGSLFLIYKVSSYVISGSNNGNDNSNIIEETVSNEKDSEKDEKENSSKVVKKRKRVTRARVTVHRNRAVPKKKKIIPPETEIHIITN